MQWLSPELDQCKSNTCLREEQGVGLGEKKQWGWFIKNPNAISQVCCLMEVHYNLNQNWPAVLGKVAFCHSSPTTEIASVSKPSCPLSAQPSRTQPLPAAIAWPLCTALIHPSSSQGWEADAFRLPAWSVTVCLASASSFPAPDVSTWCCSKLCQASSQQGTYFFLLLQRWLWCSVFYSFLPDPLFCCPVCTLLPTQGLFFNFLQSESCPYIPTSTCLFPHLPSSTFAFDLYKGQRFHKWVLRICLIIKMREYKMILQQD